MEFLKTNNSKYKFFLKYIGKKDSAPSILTSIEIIDVLKNSDMNKLVSRIFKLKKNKNLFDIDVNYKQRKIKKLRYIKIEDNVTYSQIATIKFKKDNWINKINISMTYLNKAELIVCYQFEFKDRINTVLKMHEFVVENFNKVKHKTYFTFYVNQDFFKNAKYQDVLQLEYAYFLDILQGIICTLLYTNIGENYPLPCISNYHITKISQKRLGF